MRGADGRDPAVSGPTVHREADAGPGARTVAFHTDQDTAHERTLPAVSADATTATAESTGATAEHRPLRVLIAADTFPPDVNGAATFAEQLAVGLAERGHEVHVVAPRPRATTAPSRRSTAASSSSCTG